MCTDELNGQNAKFLSDTVIGTECCNRNRTRQLRLWSQRGKGKSYFRLKKTGGKRNLYVTNYFASWQARDFLPCISFLLFNGSFISNIMVVAWW
jgi:hypothetical protein